MQKMRTLFKRYLQKIDKINHTVFSNSCQYQISQKKINKTKKMKDIFKM